MQAPDTILTISSASLGSGVPWIRHSMFHLRAAFSHCSWVTLGQSTFGASGAGGVPPPLPPPPPAPPWSFLASSSAIFLVHSVILLVSSTIFLDGLALLS